MHFGNEMRINAFCGSMRRRTQTTRPLRWRGPEEKKWNWMNKSELHWSSSPFTSGLPFLMANIVPAQFHRRTGIQQYSLFVFNWKVGCHFWTEHSIWNWNRNHSNYWKNDTRWCTKPALSDCHRPLRSEESAIGWKGHWPDRTWMSGEFTWIRPLAGPKPSPHSDGFCTEIK